MMKHLPDGFTHDPMGNRTTDLSSSGPTVLPLSHELLPGRELEMLHPSVVMAGILQELSLRAPVAGQRVGEREAGVFGAGTHHMPQCRSASHINEAIPGLMAGENIMVQLREALIESRQLRVDGFAEPECCQKPLWIKLVFIVFYHSCTRGGCHVQIHSASTIC
jgi:hypothetical protein